MNLDFLRERRTWIIFLPLIIWLVISLIAIFGGAKMGMDGVLGILLLGIVYLFGWPIWFLPKILSSPIVSSIEEAPWGLVFWIFFPIYVYFLVKLPKLSEKAFRILMLLIIVGSLLLIASCSNFILNVSF